MGPLADLRVKGERAKQALFWIDQKDKSRANQKDGLRENDFKNDLLNKEVIEKVISH